MEHEHISTSYDVELDGLRQSVLDMGCKVGLMITNSVKSLVDRDSPLAERTIAKDSEINSAEMSIDEHCLELLALRQPTARDLRFITLSLKIVNNLERIGDKCANIAKRVLELNKEPQLKPYIDLPHMTTMSLEMLRDAISAFINREPERARAVVPRDQDVDDLNRQLHRELSSYMVERPTTITRCLHLMVISKSLERIADHATNIAEEVVYLYEAKDIRHTSSKADEIENLSR